MILILLETLASIRLSLQYRDRGLVLDIFLGLLGLNSYSIR